MVFQSHHGYQVLSPKIVSDSLFPGTGCTADSFRPHLSPASATFVSSMFFPSGTLLQAEQEEVHLIA